ncbi:MAG: hypothetical protein JRJ87_09805 [Deltaproteobacteria bacterium]|nr:hypothetical protein [Deltaproteobacteria bacterium]
MKTIVWLAAAALIPACATYSTYQCPDPIGEIVRQDCDDYRVRYEKLSASLSISIGSFSIGGGVGTEKLRDPSELVQVMMHQTLALCHDYNACRVGNVEYRKRREEADRNFTAVMALLEQLKTPGLDPKNRKDLLTELFAMLKGSTPATGRQPAVAGKSDKPKKQGLTNGVFRDALFYWYASKFQPPRPPPAAKGLPDVLEINPYYERGQLKHFFLRVWGKPQEDDQFVIEGAGGRMRCPFSIRRNKPEATIRCKPKKRSDPMLQAKRFKATYTVGASGVDHDFGMIELQPDPEKLMAFLAYQPDPVKRNPIVRERPWLIIHSLHAKPLRASMTARCWVNGKPVIVDGSGALKGFTHINARNRYTKLTRFGIPLPYVMNYPATPKDVDDLLGDHSGNWRCKVSLDGEQFLEVKFTIKKDGTPEAHPAQQGKAGDLASPWWLVESRKIH